MSEITYTTHIAQLECAANESGRLNVVKTVHWRMSATDGTYTASSYGSLGLSEPDPKNFIAYDKLKESDVIAWTESLLDVDMLHTQLAADIATQKQPPVVTPPLPWQ